MKEADFERKYTRSDNYRQEFLASNCGELRCRYCHKKLSGTKKSNKLEVDHLIPIAAARRSAVARMLLKHIGCDTVNDMSNLVPACRRCNRRKSSKMGIWYIRGVLGKFETYWICLNSMKLFIIINLAAMLYSLIFLSRSA